MQVKKRMARKLITIPPNTSILKALQVMRKHSIRHLPVVDGGSFVGLVTMGDLKQASILSMVDKVSIEDVIIKKPVTIFPEASIEEAAKLIFFHQIGGLPVLKGRKLVGMITTVDILLAFIQVMGILKSSSRIDVILGVKAQAFEEVCGIFKKHRSEIISVGMSNHRDRRRRIYYFRLGKRPLEPIIQSLRAKGYKVLSTME